MDGLLERAAAGNGFIGFLSLRGEAFLFVGKLLISPLRRKQKVEARIIKWYNIYVSKRRKEK